MPQQRLSSRRMLAAGVLVVSAVSALALCAVPFSAQAGTGKCIWYDADIPPTPASPTKPLQDCGLHSEQSPEATYYWSDEAMVIPEPRALAFDYAAFGGLDPFGSEYSFRKANELFPDTSRLADAVAKAQYAKDSLGAKPRTVETRKGVTAADVCSVIPPLYSDSEIRAGDAWLAPQPLAGGPTGNYTYDLSPGLTPEQRAVVLDALVQFGTARGPRMPDLVPRAPGDTRPPTITFKDGSTDPEMGDDSGAAVVDTSDTGRDGLRRWVTGSIELTRDLDWLNPRDVAHEIAHVFQFDDTFDAGPGVTMGRAPAGQGVGVRNPWNPESGTPPANAEAFDKCLKQAFQKY
ncbi:MAG: hypothetical protein JWR01_604 [Subtercola sp.]|nr:hypothetical protein [Subtercola sp.]